jgi:hypothetical protein
VLLEGEELRSHQGDYYQQEVKGGVSAWGGWVVEWRRGAGGGSAQK